MPERGRSSLPLERLDGLRPPDPPAELRGQVVAAAAAALASGAGADIWTRLWTSRPLRLAWGATVVALVLAHVVVTPRSRLTARHNQVPAAVSAPHFDGELAEIARLPQIDPSALARLP